MRLTPTEQYQVMSAGSFCRSRPSPDWHRTRRLWMC